MKILFIMNYMYEEGAYERYRGGICRYVPQLGKAIAEESDTEVFAITYNKNQENCIGGIHYIEHRNIDVIKMYFRNIRYITNNSRTLLDIYHLADQKYISNCIKTVHPDIVNIHGCMHGIFGYIETCRLLKIPVIVTLHGILGLDKVTIADESMKGIEKELFLYADKNRLPLSVISSGIKRRAKLGYKLKNTDNISVINNGIVTNQVVEHSKIKYSFKDNQKYILCIGRIYKLKNQTMVVSAAEKVIDKGLNNIVVLFVGQETDCGELRNRIDESKYSDHFTILGEMTYQDVIELYKHSHLNIIASVTEGFGLTAIEAMTFGLQTVMFSDLDAFAELNETGAIIGVSARTADALAEGIIQGINAETKKEKLKKQAEKFQMNNIASEYINVYKQIIQGEDYYENCNKG